ncbi:UNVERIFIED_CONTAM: hypothetical protein NCL1_10353 [Trichonephila clavipes]
MGCELNINYCGPSTSPRKLVSHFSAVPYRRIPITADIRVSMTSRKRVEDSERWPAVGCIEAGQSITDGLYFGVHHSVISRLWKQFQTTQSIVRRSLGGHPRVTTPAEDR